uniref:Uncharacterized protein LOC114324518 isoform X2 n=1 Tax=Diabrotica virgifera virgifera TaxID=50390 RepID=A0A6P7F2R1_DIAVI
MEFNIGINEDFIEDYPRYQGSQLSTSADLSNLKSEPESNSTVTVKAEIKEDFVEDDPRYLESQLSTVLDLENLKNEADEDNSDPYYTDEDEEYVPSSTSESDANEDDIGSDTAEVVSTDQALHITPNKTRKRLRRPSEWKTNKIKCSRTAGKEYVSNNKVHKSKSLQPYLHACRYKCNINICEEKRQELFKALYDLPSYDHQTAFLSSCIKKPTLTGKN